MGKFTGTVLKGNADMNENRVTGAVLAMLDHE